MKFLRNLFGNGWVKLAEKEAEIQELESFYEEAFYPPHKPFKGVSEPVIAICKTFSEKGRWKIELSTQCMSYYSWRVLDTKTEERTNFTTEGYYAACIGAKLFSYYLPKTIMRSSLPNWMTDKEKEYLSCVAEQHIQKLYARMKRIERNSLDRLQKGLESYNKIERKRLMDVYCKESSKEGV